MQSLEKDPSGWIAIVIIVIVCAIVILFQFANGCNSHAHRRFSPAS